MVRLFLALLLSVSGALPAYGPQATRPVVTAMGEGGGGPPPPQCKPGFVYDKWKQRCVPAASGGVAPRAVELAQGPAGPSARHDRADKLS